MKYHLLLLYATTNHLSVFYITIGNQFHGWIEKKLQSISQSQTCIKRKKKKGHGNCLVVDPLCFMNHSETITSENCPQQINEMQQILQNLQLILVKRRGPVLLHDNTQTHHTTNASKVEQIGLQSFASSTIIS